MTDTPKDGPDFKTVENEVIAAEEKFIPILDHPIFSFIGDERLADIKNVIRTIQILDKDDYIKATVANYAELTKENKEDLFKKEFKKQFISYISAKNEEDYSKIMVNYEAFSRNPDELTFIFENIAKMIAQDISYKGEALDLLTCVKSVALVGQLPPTTIEPLKKFVYTMHDLGEDLSIYMLRQVGFKTLLLNRIDPGVVVMDSALEDIRSDILRTLIEALMYSDPQAEANSFEQLISGMNNLELHILELGKKGRPLYEREHFCIEFLLKYITNSSKAETIALNDNQAEKAMKDLTELVAMLATQKARDFTDYLESNPIREKAFIDTNYKYHTIIWPREDGNPDEA